MSCKAIDHQAERRNGLSRVWKVYCYVQALVALQFPSDLVQCFVPIMYEMWKEVVLGNLSIEDFDLLKVIGSGSWGKVLLVRSKLARQKYAMKTIAKSSLSNHSSPRAYTCFAAPRSYDGVHDAFSNQMYQYELMKMDCPFLCKHHAFFQSESKYYTIIDYIAGVELFFHLQNEKRFSEDRCRFYTAQLVIAVEYLHKNGIICREIKPQNLLLSAEGNLVLTDYFVLKPTDQRPTSGIDDYEYFCMVGSPEYFSPEIFQGMPCTKAVDYWGIGTLLFEMLTGLPPFYSADLHVMYTAQMSAEVVFPDYATGAVRDLIRKLLERDVKLRTEYGEKMRSHEWFAPIDFQLLSELRIAAPYLPNLKCYDDVSCQIADEFNPEPIWDDRTDTIVNEADFAGFTYVADHQ